MFKCGFYEKDITPPLGCNIPGYAARRPAEGVTTPLYAKALAVESGGKCVIIISIDALTMPDSVHNEAVKRIEKMTGVPSDCVLISATHTHTGGPVYEGGKYPSPYYTPDPEYVNYLGRIVGDCGVLAYQRLVPMSAKIAKGEVYDLAFNRNYEMRDGSKRTFPGFKNPDALKRIGKMDPDLPVIFFYDEEGKEKGALVNFTTHHDSVCIGYNDNFYCSDYSGALAQNLKEIYGQEFFTVFLNGACGNINHIDFFTKDAEYYYKSPFYVKIAERLTKEIVALTKELEPLDISIVDGKKELLEIKRRELPQEIIDEYEELYKTMTWEEASKASINAPDTKEYKRSRAEVFLNFAALPKTKTVNIQAIRLGDCMIFAMPGEVYCEFGIMAKEMSPLKYNMVAEMSNGCVAYIPTPEVFDTEIYEAQITSGGFVPETGEKMARLAVELGKKLVD